MSQPENAPIPLSPLPPAQSAPPASSTPPAQPPQPAQSPVSAQPTFPTSAAHSTHAQPSTPPASAAMQDPRRAPIEEKVIFDGSPTWIGRAGAFFWTIVLAALVLAGPILVKTLSARTLSPLAIPWYVFAAGVLLAILLVVGQIVYHNTLRFRITNYRIDFERGILTRRIDSLELWYIDHINFRQTLAERLGSAGTIEVITDDPRWHNVRVTSIKGARDVFEQLKTSILSAKRQRGLIEMEG